MELRIEYDIDTSNFTTSCLNAIRDFLSRTNDYTLETGIVNYTYASASFPTRIVWMQHRAYFRSNYSYFVAHSTLNDLYLIFISFGGRIGLFVSTEWDNTEEIFYQKDVIFNGFYSNQTDFSRNSGYNVYLYNQNFAYYIPMPTVGTCNKLVANYNPENETVMFSGLEPITYNFGTFTTSQNLTHSICFGNITKYGHWDGVGGFWYGGDGVCSLELYFRSSVYSAKQREQYIEETDTTITTTTIEYPYNSYNFLYADLYWQYESNCTQGLDFHKRGYWSWESGSSYQQTWYDDPFSLVANYPVARLPDTVNHFNRFECFLRIDMDNFPNRPVIEKFDDEYSLDQTTQRILPSSGFYPYPLYFQWHFGLQNNSSYNKTIQVYNKETKETITDSQVVKNVDYELPSVNRKQVWATTTLSNYYVPMIASIDNISKGLPTYWSLMPSTQTDSGHTVNDLNNISIIIRLYLMVQRDPVVLNDFSCVGYNDVINYVNMKNMSTNRYLNGTYPTKTGYYNCFQTGIRRSDLGFKGYAGLAFKMEEQDRE